MRIEATTKELSRRPFFASYPDKKHQGVPKTSTFGVDGMGTARSYYGIGMFRLQAVDNAVNITFVPSSGNEGKIRVFNTGREIEGRDDTSFRLTVNRGSRRLPCAFFVNTETRHAVEFRLPVDGKSPVR